MIFVLFPIKLWFFKNKFFIEQRRHLKHISDGDYMCDKIRCLRSCVYNFLALLQSPPSPPPHHCCNRQITSFSDLKILLGRFCKTKMSSKPRECWIIHGEPGFLSVVWFGSSPTPSPLSRRHTGKLRKKDNLLTGGVGGKGWVRSQIIRPRESLVLYKSFNTLCPDLSIGNTVISHWPACYGFLLIFLGLAFVGQFAKSYTL